MDLLQVAQVASAWRSGLTFAELTARFPFMEEIKHRPAPVARSVSRRSRQEWLWPFSG